MLELDCPVCLLKRFDHWLVENGAQLLSSDSEIANVIVLILVSSLGKESGIDKNIASTFKQTGIVTNLSYIMHRNRSVQNAVDQNTQSVKRILRNDDEA
uniref:Uncharacterized protein n=1 Tax=Romanomermis culicivorax TaxID=13658 RepID=A0A915HEQ9_ROMCU